MPTTANYGWTIPADTDLVKDGAAAIRTLGNAIDTTAASTFTPGLVKLNTTTVSGLSSQSINSVFSSTYDPYKIIINITSTSTNAGIFLRMRTGSDDTGSNYNHQRGKFGGTTIEAVRTTSDTTSYISWDNLSRLSSELLIQNPNIATDTFITTTAQLEAPSTGTVTATFNTTRVTTSTQYTGFTVYIGSGNFTGTIYTYGIRK